MEGGCGESRSVSPVGRKVGLTLKRRRGGPPMAHGRRLRRKPQYTASRPDGGPDVKEKTWGDRPMAHGGRLRRKPQYTASRPDGGPDVKERGMLCRK